MSKRCVDKLAAVFALTGHDELDLPQHLSTRVMFVYDKKENKKQFTILNKRISEEMNTKIRAWLESHLERYETTLRPELTGSGRSHTRCHPAENGGPP